MADGLNKVLLIGTVGREPEMRHAPHGGPVTTFTLASSRSWAAPDGTRREVTEWFNIVAWRELAETCHQVLHKGARVYIEGRLQTRSWEDAGGRRHARTEVVATELLLLDSAAPGGPTPDLDAQVDVYED